MDSIRSGSSGKLYSLDNFCCGKASSNGNFAYSYYTSEIAQYPSLEKIRKLMENCDWFQGFLINNSLSAGTGSGTFSKLVEEL